MKRTIAISSLITSAIWIAMTAVMMSIVVPSLVEAQASRILADQIIVGADNGASLRLSPPGAGGASHDPNFGISVIGANGQLRAQLNAGGTRVATGQPDPSAAGLNIYALDGTTISRIGTTGLSTTEVVLADRQGKNRFLAAVDDNGDPSIKLFDADGNVIWSAP